MEKRYEIIDNNGCSYVLLQKEDKENVIWELYTGSDSGWIVKNKLMATMINHGNGVKFKFTDDRKVKLNSLDYDHSEYMRLILDMENHYSKIPTEYNVYAEYFKI